MMVERMSNYWRPVAGGRTVQAIMPLDAVSLRASLAGW